MNEQRNFGAIGQQAQSYGCDKQPEPTSGYSVSGNSILGAGAVGPDPWIHRADNMRCKSCMWFVPKAASPARRQELGYGQRTAIRLDENKFRAG